MGTDKNIKLHIVTDIKKSNRSIMFKCIFWFCLFACVCAMPMPASDNVEDSKRQDVAVTEPENDSEDDMNDDDDDGNTDDAKKRCCGDCCHDCCQSDNCCCDNGHQDCCCHQPCCHTCCHTHCHHHCCCPCCCGGNGGGQGKRKRSIDMDSHETSANLITFDHTAKVLAA